MTTKLVVYDFDGVLTDNRVFVFQDGTEAVACNRSDGWYIGEIRKLNIEQVILSTETNPVVSARGKKVGLQVIQGSGDKRQSLIQLLTEKNIAPEDVVYVGNEMNDWGCMTTVKHTMAPSDSHPEILRIASYVIPVAGGSGIVRYVFEWLKRSAKPDSG